MLVLAAVPDLQLHRLRRAAGLRFALAHAPTWDDAVTTIRTRPVELAVVDPLLGGTASATETSRLRRLVPSLPLAPYTPLPRPRPASERWFLRLGLRPPRHFLAAARVLHAHRLLQDPGFTVDDVAQRLGYAQTKTLQQHARHYLGLTLGEMRDALDAQEALQRVA